MAPEVLNRASYDGRAVDTFSLGVILFIMTTGMPPFRQAGDLNHRMLDKDPVGYC